MEGTQPKNKRELFIPYLQIHLKNITISLKINEWAICNNNKTEWKIVFVTNCLSILHILLDVVLSIWRILHTIHKYSDIDLFIWKIVLLYQSFHYVKFLWNVCLLKLIYWRLVLSHQLNNLLALAISNMSQQSIFI